MAHKNHSKNILKMKIVIYKHTKSLKKKSKDYEPMREL